MINTIDIERCPEFFRVFTLPFVASRAFIFRLMFTCGYLRLIAFAGEMASCCLVSFAYSHKKPLESGFFYGAGEGNVRCRSPVEPVARALPCATFAFGSPNPDEGSHPHHPLTIKKTARKRFLLWSG